MCVLLLEGEERKQLVQKSRKGGRKPSECSLAVRGGRQFEFKGIDKRKLEGVERGDAWVERTGGCEVTLERHQTLGTQTESFSHLSFKMLFFI